jgi:hypothetical protein
MNPPASDLTQHPPRSPRVRLGGFAILPRMLDKGRAVIAGTPGEYKYACPLDQQLLQFVGVDAEALRQQLAAGKGDSEILEWVLKQSTTKPTPAQIASWSGFQEQRGPADPDAREFFNDVHRKIAPHRSDLASWFDLLDLDDYVSFGGKA